MLKKILIGIAVLVLLIVAVGLFLPTEYRVEKSLAMQATPAQVHAYVGDLEKWDEWTPWVEDDPTIVTTFGEKTQGVGAHQSWTSESGDGELTLTKCDEQTGIAYDMAFIMGETRAPATSAMSYDVSGGTTTVTWTMEGDVGDFMPPVVSGYMTPMLKSQIGTMFDRGLAKLKEKAEAYEVPVPEPAEDEVEPLDEGEGSDA